MMKFAFNFKRFLLLAIMDDLISEVTPDDHYTMPNWFDNIELLDKLLRKRWED